MVGEQGLSEHNFEWFEPKRGGNAMPRGRKVDTLEEAAIRREIDAKGIKQISPSMVLAIPRVEMEPLVMEGLTDVEVGEALSISKVSVNGLRKFYDLPFYRDVKAMLSCVGDDGDGEKDAEGGETYIVKQPDEVLEMNVTLKNDGTLTEMVASTVKVAKKNAVVEEVPMTINEARVREGLEPLKEMNLMQTSEPPLLNVKMMACMAAPLVNGIAKYLDRLDGVGVEVVVTVRVVNGK